MAIAVRLPDEMVNEAQKYAHISCRSTPKQIEYWYKNRQDCGGKSRYAV